MQITTDWSAIERDYRAGSTSVRAIAEREGVSDTAIHKRAKTHGWVRGNGLHPDPAAAQNGEPEWDTILDEDLCEQERVCWVDGTNGDRPLYIHANESGQVVLKFGRLNDGDDFLVFNIGDIDRVTKKMRELAREIAAVTCNELKEA